MLNFAATVLFLFAYIVPSSLIAVRPRRGSRTLFVLLDGAAGCLQLRKWRSINVRQLAVVPVPVAASEEPVLGAGVGVLPLLKPPGGRTADQRSANPLFHFQQSAHAKQRERRLDFCCVSVVAFTANRWRYNTHKPWNYVSAILEILSSLTQDRCCGRDKIWEKL